MQDFPTTTRRVIRLSSNAHVRAYLQSKRDALLTIVLPDGELIEDDGVRHGDGCECCVPGLMSPREVREAASQLMGVTDAGEEVRWIPRRLVAA